MNCDIHPNPGPRPNPGPTAGTKAVCVLRNETVKELKPTDPATGECHGNDIDKINVKARHGVVFTTSVEHMNDGSQDVNKYRAKKRKTECDI